MACEVFEGMNTKRTFRLERKDLMDPLGRGAFGYVVRVFEESTNKEYAAKRMDLGKPSFPMEIYEYEKKNALNIKAMADKIVGPKNLAIPIDECLNGKLYYLIYDFYHAKDLRQYMKTVEYIPEDEAWEIIRQVYNGLFFIHKNLNLIHRDLKLDNIFLDTKTEKDNSPCRFKCYLGDFGLSKKAEEAETDCGTRETKAPEVSTGDYDTKADLYSLGVIFYQMLFNTPPFRVFSTPTTEMVNGTYQIHKNNKVSDLAVAFIEACIQKDPKERASGEELREFLQLDSLSMPFRIPPTLRTQFSTKPQFTECSFIKGRKLFKQGPLKLYKEHLEIIANKTFGYKEKCIQLDEATCLSVIWDNKIKEDAWIDV